MAYFELSDQCGTSKSSLSADLSAIFRECIRRVKDPSRRFVVCIDNSGHEASLEFLNIYAVVSGDDVAAEGDLRIVDESGEDYLYTAERFVAIEVPKAVQHAMLRKAS